MNEHGKEIFLPTELKRWGLSELVQSDHQDYPQLRADPLQEGNIWDAEGGQQQLYLVR